MANRGVATGWLYSIRADSMRIGVKLKCAIIGIVILIVIAGKPLLYIICEFILLRNGTFNRCGHCEGDGDPSTSTIPRHIHQIWFGVTEQTIPLSLQQFQHSWTQRNPGYNYTLWNGSMVDNLIRTDYRELLPLYNSYAHWVQRVDVARYVILHRYGGVYVDLDIGCHKGIEQLIAASERKSETILYWTKPLAISNDFMISKPRHYFLYDVIYNLNKSNQWFFSNFLTVMLSTGPLYVYGRYLNYANKSDVVVLDYPLSSWYLIHTDGQAWHGTDAALLWSVYLHGRKILNGLFILICGVCLVYVIARCRKYRHYNVLLYRRHA